MLDRYFERRGFAFCFSGASGVFPEAHVAPALPASMVPALGSWSAWQPVAFNSFPWHPPRQFHKDVSPARHPSMNTFPSSCHQSNFSVMQWAELSPRSSDLSPGGKGLHWILDISLRGSDCLRHVIFFFFFRQYLSFWSLFVEYLY